MRAPRPRTLRHATLLRVAVLLSAALATTGCYTLRADLPGTLRNDLHGETEVIGTVHLEVSHTFLLNGLVGTTPPDILADPLLAEVARQGGDGVANLVVEARFSPADIILNTITLGIVTPRTYRLRGDVVRIRAPALPGRPLLGDERRKRR